MLSANLSNLQNWRAVFKINLLFEEYQSHDTCVWPINYLIHISNETVFAFLKNWNWFWMEDPFDPNVNLLSDLDIFLCKSLIFFVTWAAHTYHVSKRHILVNTNMGNMIESSEPTKSRLLFTKTFPFVSRFQIVWKECN